MAATSLCTLGTGACVDDGVHLGYPPGRTMDVVEARIGERARIRTGTVIYTNVVIGDDFETGHNVVIREENVFGDGVAIWNNSCVDYGCRIGNRVRIHNNVYICQFTTIEDDVFLGPGAMLANDPHPICTGCMRGPTLRKGCRVGMNATVAPHVDVGEGALVAAGSMVIRDVPAGAFVCGNPARVVKKVDEMVCGFGRHIPYVDGVDVRRREI